MKTVSRALAEQRFALAQKIVAAAEAAGIPREDVYIDCLTLTASAQQEAVRETLKAVRMVKERLGVKTVLGVSNISFGLPCREQVNTSFLTLAMAHGLDLPIINPNAEAMMAAVASFKVLYNIDRDSREYLARYAGQAAVQPVAQQTVTLYDAVLQGLKAAAAQAARTALQAKSRRSLSMRCSFRRWTRWAPVLKRAYCSCRSFCSPQARRRRRLKS